MHVPRSHARHISVFIKLAPDFLLQHRVATAKQTPTYLGTYTLLIQYQISSVSLHCNSIQRLLWQHQLLHIFIHIYRFTL